MFGQIVLTNLLLLAVTVVSFKITGTKAPPNVAAILGFWVLLTIGNITGNFSIRLHGVDPIRPTHCCGDA